MQFCFAKISCCYLLRSFLDFAAENSHSYKIHCGKVRRSRALAPKNPPWYITSYMDRRRFFRRTTFLDSKNHAHSLFIHRYNARLYLLNHRQKIVSTTIFPTVHKLLVSHISPYHSIFLSRPARARSKK